ncbi:peptide ABC transporter permease [Carboxydothermus islandicus]|uniref:Peptide ABC transporter permease n=1 Tax=Carboxydothermus islandicus TaxID=661089 RepID=A0A1L8D3N4_9THEO|nr:ABC transporter permease [Carboxydothermus islandicus]GAV25783.1 peptide ABC transporter permease [Carboxydothermus islandicus]
MGRFLLQRLTYMLVALLLIITFTFILMHVVPGGPFASEKQLPESVMKNLNEKFHLNDPLWLQYVKYLQQLLKGDLGVSFKYEGRTVNDFIKNGFPVSATLGAVSVMIALIFGISLGIISALNQNKWQDYIATIFATIGFSVPSFIMASLLMYFFAYKIKLFPTAMWGTPAHVVLPAIALATLPTAFISRIVRSNMIEVLQQDYIKTARAKGMSERVVIYKHALKNAILPVVTYLGPLIAGVFTGSFVVEKIFAIPGIGRDFVISIVNRDYGLILGLTVFYAAFLMLMNLLVDLSYALIDPRIKLTRKEG